VVKYSYWEYDLEQLTEFANKVKDALSERLELSDQLDHMAVVLVKPNMFGRIIKNLCKWKDGDGFYIQIMSLAEPAPKPKKGK
jgi:hypothetical protein